jgi:hypothetical protein
MRDVREALIGLDVIVQTADEIPSGAEISVAILDALKSADFVCVAISAKPSSSVMFEAGLASGLGRPLLVVADAGVADGLPVDIMRAPVIRYKSGMTQILRENLSAYVNRVQPVAVQHLLNEEVVVEFAALPPRAPKIGRNSRVEEHVASRLEAAGALVASESRLPGNLRPDIVATFPGLGTEFNPIIVEVKDSRSQGDDSVTMQVRNYLKAARARLGVIVDQSRVQAPATRIYESTGILYVTANDLDAWDNDRLLDELTRLRNKVVHSV